MMRMLQKRGLLLLFLCLGTSVSVMAQKGFSVAAAPSWVLPADFNAQATPSNQEEAGSVHFILLDKQYHVAQEALYRQVAFKILNEKGLQDNADISVEYDPSFQSLTFHSIEVIRDGRHINKLHKQDFKVIQREDGADAHLYDGRLTAVVHLKDIRIGDILSYAYSIRGRNPIYQGKFFEDNIWQFDQEVEKMAVRVLLDKGRKLQIKARGDAPQPSIRELSPQLQEYLWTKEKVSPLVYDSQIPPWYDPAPQTQMSEMPDWGSVVGLLLADYQVQQPIPDEKWQLLAKELFGPEDDQEERITKLVHFVQNDIRYLGLENGISAYKPHPPLQVLEQKFGDCKDKALLLCALLDKIGVEAQPALVNTYLRGEVKEHLPSPAVFNHCIVNMQYQDSTYWFDATFNGQGGTIRNMSLPHYKQALLIKKGESQLRPVMDYPHDSRIIKQYFSIKPAAEPTELTIMSRYRGYEAENQRTHFKNNNIRDVEKTYLNYFAGLYPGISLKSELKARERGAAFETEEHYLLHDFWEKSTDDERYVKASFYPLYLNDYLQVPEKKIRQMPFQLNYPLHIREELILDLQEYWRIEDERKTVSNAFFTFEYQVTYKHPVVTISYDYVLHKNEVPAAQIAAYTKDVNRAKEMLGYELTSATGAEQTSSVSIPILVLVVAFLLLLLCAFVLLYKRYDPLPGKENYYDNEGIGGWLFLPMLGLMVTPIRVLASTISWDYFDENAVHPFFDAASPFFHPLHGSVLVVELLFNLSQALAAVFLLLLFFERRTSFPRLMCIYLLSNFGFILLELIILDSAQLVSDSELSGSYGQLGRAFIGCAIWVPYMLVSERVKSTFTVTRKPKPLDPSVQTTYTLARTDERSFHAGE